MFIVLVMCLVAPVGFRDRLIWEEGAGCFGVLWFEQVSVVVCSFFFLVSLVGYVL